MIPRRPHGLRPVLLPVLLASLSFPASAWESPLFGPGWQAEPALSFETDKIVQDYSFAGYRRGEVPLPASLPGATFDVTTHGADPSGGADSTAAIQAAIDAAEAAGGGIVWMPAGTYLVRPQGTDDHCLAIRGGGVILRGAGVERTFLLNTETAMRAKSILSVAGPSSAAWATQTSPSPAIVTDLAGPVSRIPVTDSSGFTPGDCVIVRADPGDDWALEHNEPDWVGHSPGSFGRLLYFREVLAVDPDAHTLTLDIPTRYTLKTRDQARIYRKNTLLREIGLEHFSIGNVQHPSTSGWGENDFSTPGTSAHDVHGCYAIRLSRVRDSWIRGVHSFRPAANTTTCHLLNNGILLTECARVTVRDCHFQRPQYGGGGGAGYMYRLQNSGDCLVQNCTAEFCRHGFVFSHMASSGNVLHACLDKTTGKQTGASGNQTTSGKGSDHHMQFSHSNLIDVCVADDSWYEARYRPFGSDPKHNLTSAHTVIWNTEGKPSSRSYVVHSQQSRYGYVIGTRGAVTAVKTDGDSTSKTAPVDHVEGMGQGGTLTPFSLFREQRRRRLLLPSIPPMAAQTVFFPHHTATAAPSVLFGDGATAPPDTAAFWTRIGGPGVSDLQPGSGFSMNAGVSLPGLHTFQFTVSRHGSLEDDFAATALLEVTVLPSGWLETELTPVADAFVQSGNADTNSNTGALWMKFVGASSTVNREIFMRFDLAPLAGRTVEQAVLELHATEPDTDATAQTHLVPDDTWGETSLTWNSRPAVASLLQTWALAPDYLQRIDLTTTVANEAASDGLLSLRHSIVHQATSATVFKYGSREASNPAIRPRLRVLHHDGSPAFAEWMAAFPSLTAADRDPSADPDADSLTNLEEYARRLAPDLPQSRPPSLQAQSTGLTRLHLPGAASLPSGVHPVIEHSPSLTTPSWQAVLRGQFQFAGADLIFTPPADLMQQSRGFFRLRLEVLP